MNKNLIIPSCNQIKKTWVLMRPNKKPSTTTKVQKKSMKPKFPNQQPITVIGKSNLMQKPKSQRETTPITRKNPSPRIHFIHIQLDPVNVKINTTQTQMEIPYHFP